MRRPPSSEQKTKPQPEPDAHQRNSDTNAVPRADPCDEQSEQIKKQDVTERGYESDADPARIRGGFYGEEKEDGEGNREDEKCLPPGPLEQSPMTLFGIVHVNDG